jgi:hypothetical protein
LGCGVGLCPNEGREGGKRRVLGWQGMRVEENFFYIYFLL